MLTLIYANRLLLTVACGGSKATDRLLIKGPIRTKVDYLPNMSSGNIKDCHWPARRLYPSVLEKIFNQIIRREQGDVCPSSLLVHFGYDEKAPLPRHCFNQT